MSHSVCDTKFNIDFEATQHNWTELQGDGRWNIKTSSIEPFVVIFW
jgi:hypothetical protein